MIYLETHKERFELAWEGQALEGDFKPEDVAAQARGLSGHAPTDILTVTAEVLVLTLREMCVAPCVFSPQDSYRWSRCKAPLPVADMHSLGMPLPANQVEARAHARKAPASSPRDAPPPPRSAIRQRSNSCR